MAIMEALVKKSLVLAINEGTNEDGKEIIKRYSFSNVKVTATPQNLYDTAQAISSLCNGAVEEFNVVDTTRLY